MKITKKMNIKEVVSRYPETAEVFIENGMHCLECAAVHFEDIEQGALAHSIDVKKLIKDLNKAVKKK